MRRWLALCATALVIPTLSASAEPNTHGQWWDGRPPDRFQAPTRTKLQTVVDVQASCARHHRHPLPDGAVIFACTYRGVVTMPNPCDFPAERFAALLCHELGHVNGWSGNHEL